MKAFNVVGLHVLCVGEHAVLMTDGVYLEEFRGRGASAAEHFMCWHIKKFVKPADIVSDSEYESLKAKYKATEVLAIAEHERMLAEMSEQE